MDDKKLARICALIEQKKSIDTELAQLIGEQERPKRGRKPRGTIQEATPPEE